MDTTQKVTKETFDVILLRKYCESNSKHVNELTNRTKMSKEMKKYIRKDEN